MNILALNQQLQHRAPMLIAAILSVVVLFSTISNFKQWYSDWAFTHAATGNAQHLDAKDETAAMISAIPTQHIFGQNIAVNGEVPITNLELRVTGIVKTEAKNTESLSKAYISIAGKPSKIYQVGDSLPYGVKVYDISSDAIILENDGHLEKLPLPRDRLEFKPREVA